MAAAFAIAVFWLVQASAVTLFLVPFIFHRYLAQNSLPGRRAAHSYDSWAATGNRALAQLYTTVYESPTSRSRR